MTMLEILVVTAIVVILVALVFGVGQIALESSRRAKCASGMRQAGLQIHDAALRNGFQLPLFYAVKPQGHGYKIFTQPPPKRSSDIGSFISPHLLLCPSDKNPQMIDTKDAAGNDVDLPTSYGFNFIPAMMGARTIDLDQSRTFLMFDGKYDNSAQQGIWNGDASDIARFNTDLGVPRHNKKFNVYFLDGRIERLSTLPASGVFAQ